MTQRDPLYREVAHLVVDTGSQSLRTLVARLESTLLTRSVTHPKAVEC
jgi:shikimate kinase